MANQKKTPDAWASALSDRDLMALSAALTFFSPNALINKMRGELDRLRFQVNAEIVVRGRVMQQAYTNVRIAEDDHG